MKSKAQMIAFIQSQKTAFVASVDEEGFPNIKAMFAPERIEGNDFYFSTNLSSMRSQQFLKNPKASIYFYKKGRYKFEGLMLTGQMEVCCDHETKASIWHPQDVMYYPEGVDDPDYCVLKFTAQRGRYYTALHSESFSMEELPEN